MSSGSVPQPKGDRQWLARLNRGEILGELSTHLDPESVGVPFLISINELKVIAHGRKHAFADMAPEM
jgi:hypothetical protein